MPERIDAFAHVLSETFVPELSDIQERDELQSLSNA